MDETHRIAMFWTGLGLMLVVVVVTAEGALMDWPPRGLIPLVLLLFVAVGLVRASKR